MELLTPRRREPGAAHARTWTLS